MYTVVKVLFLRNPNNRKALLANKLYFHNSVCLLWVEETNIDISILGEDH